MDMHTTVLYLIELQLENFDCNIKTVVAETKVESKMYQYYWGSQYFGTSLYIREYLTISVGRYAYVSRDIIHIYLYSISISIRIRIEGQSYKSYRNVLQLGSIYSNMHILFHYERGGCSGWAIYCAWALSDY